MLQLIVDLGGSIPCVYIQCDKLEKYSFNHERDICYFVWNQAFSVSMCCHTARVARQSARAR